MPHPFGITGLIFNTVGALGLLKFVPNPDAGAALPHESLQSLRLSMPDQRRAYTRQIWSYRICVIALIVGFCLQLVDLITT
jgi:hypothetical protein